MAALPSDAKDEDLGGCDQHLTAMEDKHRHERDATVVDEGGFGMIGGAFFKSRKAEDLNDTEGLM
jgi:hypothetical protein